MSAIIDFQGFRLVFHFSRLVFSFLVFMVFKVPGWLSRFKVSFSWFQAGFSRCQNIFMVFKVPGWFFMVSDGFFWLFKVPGWFLTVPGGFYGF